MKTFISILSTIIMLTGSLFAQDVVSYSLSGIVRSQTNSQPLEGVSVKVKSSEELIISDSDGKFTVSINSHLDTLFFGHIGYEDTFRIIEPSYLGEDLVVFMQEKIIDIENVVVSTGYQLLKSNEITGSVQVLDNKAINRQIGTNILERLNNISTSLRFDNDPINNSELQKTNLSVRGLSTINGHLDPLIVLDGFIYEGNILNIDPNSIDNITILKDAAAAAIWGARAGNGVIVIKSKKSGEIQKNSLSFNSTVSFRQQPDLKEVYQLDNEDFIAVEEFLFQHGYYDRQLQRTPYQALTPATEILYNRQQGRITPADSLKLMEELKTTDIRKSYARYFFVKPITQQYSLNMTGGIPSNAYNLGIGYTSSRSENNSKDDKINVIVGNTFRPISKLRVDVNLMFTNGKGRSGMPAYDNFTYSGKQVPYGRFKDEEGKPLAFYGSYRQEFIQSYMTEYLLDWRNIPVEDYKYSKANTTLTEFYPTVNASYQIFPFWDVNLAGQYQHQSVENININDLESYAARSMINKFTIVDQNTGNVEHNVPLGGIKKSIKNEISSYTFRFHNNLDKRWGEQRLLGVVGAEIRENLNQGESYTVYGYSELPLQTIPVNYTESFPTLPGNASQKISGDPRYTQKRNRFVSLYSNLSYMMYERYGVSASVRRDGANVFGASTNDKWTPLWSAGLFWNVNDESFFNNNLLSKLKVRATYGVSGNIDLRKTPLPIAGSISSMYTNLPALLVSDLNDPSLRWEKVATLNLGIDFNTKGGRIDANIDYYRKNGTDLYGLDLYDYTVWGLQGTIIRNAGAMRGTGMDITVNTKNIVGQFNWNTTILFSTNKNKTTKYYNREYEGINSFLSGGSIITPIVGMPLNSLAAYKWGGLDNDGNPMGYLNGELSTDYNAIRNQQQVLDNDVNNIIFLGSSKPQVFGSIINDFTFKNWELSFNISFKGDYYFRKPTTSYTNLFARGTAFPDFEDRWKQVGDEEDTNVPSMLYPSISNRDNFYAMSEINVYRGEHVRLEYINLSYTLPLRFKQQFRSLVLYSNINNPGLLWTGNKKRIDPEFPYRMSPRRVISFGLKTNF